MIQWYVTTIFNSSTQKYQNLTKYSLIEDLGIEKLTNKEIGNLPD